MPGTERRASRRLLIVALLGLVAASAAGVLLAFRGAGRLRGLAIGDEIPRAVLRATDGDWSDTASWNGTPHLVLLFQAGCPACREEIRILSELAAAAAAPPRVRLVALDPEREARGFAREVRTPFPILTDPTGRFIRKARKLVVPTLYRIDAAGRVTHTRTGQMSRLEAARLLASLAREAAARARRTE